MSLPRWSGRETGEPRARGRERLSLNLGSGSPARSGLPPAVPGRSEGPAPGVPTAGCALHSRASLLRLFPVGLASRVPRSCRRVRMAPLPFPFKSPAVLFWRLPSARLSVVKSVTLAVFARAVQKVNRIVNFFFFESISMAFKKKYEWRNEE